MINKINYHNYRKMIGISSKIEPKKIFVGGVEIQSIHIMNILVWSNKSGDAESCFAGGQWNDSYPWTDNLSWPA